MPQLNRRSLLAGVSSAAALGLGGCVGGQQSQIAANVPAGAPSSAPAGAVLSQAGDFNSMYGEVKDGKFVVPAVRQSDLGPAFRRSEVAYSGSEAPGTIVIDPTAHYLYLVESGGKAMRYGIGVGREGFAWSGASTVNSKQEWPDWYPPKEMLERRPELLKQMSQLQSGTGMPGGPSNPLGARAHYLYQGKVDTLYRIHGTNEPATIGQSVSSGCIRMVNQDVMDLYQRTSVGTKVVVLGSAQPVKVAHS
ncbi:ErfK/YbiS/YcfS/YnhG family protein [Methylocella silvestris BL2]|uniref:ErfK/YbiS/YcfS/YnhG family protein n=1 Tax=Methylocella silvestris (strain DSM 15510 / CIP 108128 / LMG 27833 / NCIMB 13906 / BL2) TaxID=395965 RepID=B8EKR4_METSB|nr:L,D-transpeptidase [Methylocella silvestris]ACK51942.1 ErfK/YbiS/YcfS/YnhG family protein [Methylocella silvestris BL2]